MTIKKANLKKLASLSALGAGTVGAAHASSIIFSGPVNSHFGNCHRCTGGPEIGGLNGAGGVLYLFSHIESSMGPSFRFVELAGEGGANGTGFQFLGGLASAFPLGAKWGNRPGYFGHGTVAGIAWTPSYPTFGTRTLTNFHGSDKYLLFRFVGGNLPEDLYGWALLNVTNPAKHKLEVTVVDWAYNTSGAQIPAGDTGTPEPSPFVLTGLAALALGAKGLRAWRTAR